MTDHSQETRTVLIDRTANPAPLGLMAFGMTTIMLSLSNAGAFGLGPAILGMAIFFGGLAQIIAGLMEWKKGNTFGTTVFSSFGFFWVVIATIVLFPKFGLGTESPQALAALMFLWGCFAAYLTIGTIGTNRVFQLIFVCLTIVLFLLSGADAFGSTELKVMGGLLGILAGASAFYLAMSMTLKEALGRSVVPVFEVKKKAAAPKEGERVRKKVAD